MKILGLYNKRTDIINAFIYKDIFFGNLDPKAESETGSELEPESGSESSFKESISKRTKMRRQKKLMKKIKKNKDYKY